MSSVFPQLSRENQCFRKRCHVGAPFQAVLLAWGVDGHQVRDAGEAAVLGVGLRRGPVLGLRLPLPIHVSVEVWLFLELPAHTPCLHRNVKSSVFIEGPAPSPVSPVSPVICPWWVLSTSSPSEWAQPPPSREVLAHGSGSPSPVVLATTCMTTVAWLPCPLCPCCMSHGCRLGLFNLRHGWHPT